MSQAFDTIKAIECAAEEALASREPLHIRLRELSDRLGSINPAIMAASGEFIHRLQRAEAGVNAPKVGDVLPNFVLPDQSGNLVDLASLTADGPAVIVFMRGHWCPYCQLHAAAIASMEHSIEALGGKVVVITPESRRYTRRMQAGAGAGFPILTDMDAAYASMLNLAIWVDDAMAEMIMDAGWNIATYCGNSSWLLPIPATLVVATDGVIAAREVNPDYRARMAPEDILAALRALRHS
jgi:peroxiredoxin